MYYTCLNVHAPVFQLKAVQCGDSCDSALCFSPEQGYLSRSNTDGRQLSVKHPLSYKGFQRGLVDCPDKELAQFVLDGIHNGVRLGSLDGVVDANPHRCLNGWAVRG